MMPPAVAVANETTSTPKRSSRCLTPAVAPLKGSKAYDRNSDYYRLTHEQPKRRLDLSIPTECLFIEKATGEVPHSGGSPTKKGDPLETARLAGIMAAKKTSELIPLCHPVPLSHVDVELRQCENGIMISTTAKTNAETGVEMEALVAASVAALTVYDMCKALDKSIEIREIMLERKTGGKSGKYIRKK